MTVLSPPPVSNDTVNPIGFPDQQPPPRRHRLLPGRRRRNATIGVGLTGLLVAGLLGASYEASPGGSLWGVEKTVFPGHAQDVALTAVANDLKQAQDILGSGQQPSADQLTDARTDLNQAKENLDYLSASPQRDSLQNLYLQLTQQLLQETPDSVQQLPPLPGVPDASPPPNPVAAPPAPADPAPGQPATDPFALTSASAPTWGYGDSGDAESVAGAAPEDFVPPPADVPIDPEDDWPQPYDPPPTPNLEDLGYYDPSWGQLYGYDPGNWYNFDLGGFNIYGFDFLGFNRWGYDRWGYDRWGYDRWGYNWSGYNWAGYDRDGWDRDGCNDWGQRRGFPGDPRNQDWYNHHHPYEQYYQWKFQNDDPVYHRTQWDQAHGFNPDRYRDWNTNRDWHNPRNRDWASTVNNTTVINNVAIRNSAPVVNPKTSLAQFISNDKATSTSAPLLKDLASKSPRAFTKDLTAQTTTPIKLLPAMPGQQPPSVPASRQNSFAPPSLTATAPAAPPSKVSPGFTVPKVAPVPTPGVDKPDGQPKSLPRNAGPGTVQNPSPGTRDIPPSSHEPNSVGAPDRAGAPGAEPKPATPPKSVVDPPARQDQPPQRVAPEPPVRDVQPPKAEASKSPAREAPVQREPAPQQPPERQTPVHQAPAPAAPAKPAPARPAAPPRPAAPEPRPAPQAAPAPRPAAPPRPAPAPAPRPAPPRPAAPAPRPAPAPQPAPAPHFSAPVQGNNRWP